MNKTMTGVFFCVMLAACGASNDSLDTTIPADMGDLPSIRPAVEKLSQDEQKLFAGYVMRHMMEAQMKKATGGASGPDLPAGVTLRVALEEQRQFEATK